NAACVADVDGVEEHRCADVVGGKGGAQPVQTLACGAVIRVGRKAEVGHDRSGIYRVRRLHQPARPSAWPCSASRWACVTRPYPMRVLSTPPMYPGSFEKPKRTVCRSPCVWVTRCIEYRPRNSCRSPTSSSSA